MSTLYVSDGNGGFVKAKNTELFAAAEAQARKALHKGVQFDKPATAKTHLVSLLANKDHEVFCVAFLDAGHRLLAFEELFRGTVNKTAIYNREIIKKALELNAVLILPVHNHPSGDPTPSDQDLEATQALARACELFDIRLLDHYVVGGDKVVSILEVFQEKAKNAMLGQLKQLLLGASDSDDEDSEDKEAAPKERSRFN